MNKIFPHIVKKRRNYLKLTKFKAATTYTNK